MQTIIPNTKIDEELRKETFDIDRSIDLFVEQNNRMTHPLKTEFDFLKWLDEGRLVTVGGGSGLGKTAFVLQMLYELVRDNQDREDSVIGIYASAEMMIEELTMRLIVNQEVLENVNMLNVRKIFNKKLTSPKKLEEYKNKAKFILGSIPFYFLNASKFNLNSIMQLIKKTRKKNPDKRIFVVIDYLQLLLAEVDSLPEMNRAIKALKDCVIENKANAIIISALNRDAIKNNYVDMSAFIGSSMIEYTSDIAILFAFKNDKGKYTLKIDEEKRNANELEFYAYCVKNRIGQLFSSKLIFNKLQQRFTVNPVKVITLTQEEFEKQEKSATSVTEKHDKENLKDLTFLDII